MKVLFRSLEPFIRQDLEKKFVFLSGPRQVGKTTLANSIIQQNKGLYLSYDHQEDRRKILSQEFVQKKWVCLDELHKHPRWKNLIKGVHDKHHADLRLILTGSARLDVFQKSGDSLFGRYLPHRLHPFSIGELEKNEIQLPTDVHELHPKSTHAPSLLKFSGFPEPLIAQSERGHLRWSNNRHTTLIQEELRDLTEIKLVELVDQLMLLLPTKIGSIFSYRSLAEDIRVSVPTIQSWIETLRRLFVVFRLSPYSQHIARSIQKQPKFYLWDWSQIQEPGARFENFVASHLWKASQTWTDLGLANVGLHFIRDRNGREVDFLLTRNSKPWFLVEAKISETRISDTLKYFSQRLGVPAIQLIEKGNIEKREGNITLTSCARWLGKLP